MSTSVAVADALLYLPYMAGLGLNPVVTRRGWGRVSEITSGGKILVILVNLVDDGLTTSEKRAKVSVGVGEKVTTAFIWI